MRGSKPLGLAGLVLVLAAGCGRSDAYLTVSTLHIEEFVFDGFGSGDDIYVTVVKEPGRILESSGPVFQTTGNGTLPVTLNNIVWRYREYEDNPLWLAAVADDNANGQADDTDLFMPMLRLELTPGGVTTLKKVEFVNYYSYGTGTSGYYTLGDNPHFLRLENRLPVAVGPDSPIGLRLADGVGPYDMSNTNIGFDTEVFYRVYSPKVSAVYMNEGGGGWTHFCPLAYYDADGNTSQFGGEPGDYASADPAAVPAEGGQEDHELILSLDNKW